MTLDAAEKSIAIYHARGQVPDQASAKWLKSCRRREEECGDASEAAIDAMCERPPTTAAGAQAVLLHFVSEHERGNLFDEEQWAAMAKTVGAGLAAIGGR